MSKTDKTHPGWVKVQQNLNSPSISEYHDHRRGSCDLHTYKGGPRCFWWHRERTCGYDVSYYGYHGGFYPRPPRGKEIRNLMEGAERANWRRTAHELRKLSREDIEEYDVYGYRHRHSALWEMY